MQHPQFDGVILEDKWGKTYLCSNCLFAYSELSDNTLWHSRDKVYASYFLHDLQPEWNQRQIWANIYRQARPWQSDLSGLTDFQLRDSLIHMLANDEIRLWQLTECWGQPPEDNGIGDGGLAPATSSAPPPLRSTPKRQGGAIASADTTEVKAAENKASPSNEPRKPTLEELSLAKSEGDSKLHIEARQNVSRYFLESNGFSEEQIANAIGDEVAGIDGGVDLTKPVEIFSFPPPDEMTQYVKSHGFPGNWFDPTSEQTPDQLGLSGEGRTLSSFKMPKSQGLLSHSKPIVDNWTNPSNPVSTSGGGMQLFVNDDTKKAVISLNKIGM